jgi:hypothetical protein
VDAATKNEKLKAWLTSQGVKLPRKLRKGELRTSLDADDIEKLLAGDLPNARVRAALEIRLQAAQSAASKIDRMLRTLCRCAPSSGEVNIILVVTSTLRVRRRCRR